jgi:hypothetical protein
MGRVGYIAQRCVIFITTFANPDNIGGITAGPTQGDGEAKMPAGSRRYQAGKFESGRGERRAHIKASCDTEEHNCTG